MGWNNRKNRGKESPDITNKLSSARPILTYFIKKFNMPIEETLERLKFTVQEDILPQV